MTTYFPLRRTESKKAAATEESDSEGAASADEAAPTSDIEMPDVEDGSDKEEEKSALKKGKKSSSAKKGKKRTGGVMIPDEWPWEEAKKIFVNPDVLPADEIEVKQFRII